MCTIECWLPLQPITRCQLGIKPGISSPMRIDPTMPCQRLTATMNMSLSRDMRAGPILWRLEKQLRLISYYIRAAAATTEGHRGRPTHWHSFRTPCSRRDHWQGGLCMAKEHQCPQWDWATANWADHAKMFHKSKGQVKVMRYKGLESNNKFYINISLLVLTRR